MNTQKPSNLLAGPPSDLLAAPNGQPPTPNEPNEPWALLRNDLRLSKGPPSSHGAPTWTLHDQAAHRFFRIGWLEFEIISRWALGSVEAICESIQSETTLSPSPESVQAVRDFALQNCLLEASSASDCSRLLQMKNLGHTGLGHKIMHGYLFMRIPLLAPDAWLQRNLPLVRWMFSKKFCITLILAAIFGLYLISREWVSFILNIESLWSWQQSIVVILSLGLAKTLHELGHAFAAKHLGLRVPRMGMALMCFSPVLWTDVTEAWKLPKRADRLLVDLSGVGAELILATTASLIWPLLPPGEIKSAVLTLAGVTWLTTLAVNGNPFMRYDGYYILSDYWEIPGLQQRAFALARWRLREFLFGFGDSRPEAMTMSMQRKLLVYAYGTWLYRFFLFFGIALLVYHLFFKILGLALMLVEIMWFIAMPIYKELRHWHSRRASIRLSPRTACFGLAIAGLILLFTIPWHTKVEGFALLSARRMAALYVPGPSMVLEVKVTPGHAVKTGDALVVLSSPDIDSNIRIVTKKLENLRSKVAASSLDLELRTTYASDVKEMQSTARELAGLRKDEARLTVKSPIDGVFHDLPAWVVPGVWVPEKMKLGAVAEPDGMLTAYVAEEDLERLSVGATGKFYPASGLFQPVTARVQSLEHTAVREIPQPELPATMQGGIIPSKRLQSGSNVPEQALYRVICMVEDTSLPPFSLNGKVFFEGTRRSFAVRFWQAAMGILIRESSLE